MTLPVFVYGTLRAGCANDIRHLVAGVVPQGAARVRGRLYAAGWYPHLILDATADWVAGELYLVPETGWALLDALEEIVTPARPDGEYFRRTARVDPVDGPAERSLDAVLYEGNPAVLPTDVPIDSGDWVRYAAEHGITRFARPQKGD